MAEVTLTVVHPAGLHARPAALFVQAANQYSCEVKVLKGDKAVNAKSILGVLSLGVHCGEEITVFTEGEDAKEAISCLEELIKSNFEST